MRKASDRTFSSLKIRNYRLYFVGQLVSVSGTWIQWVAQTSLIVYTLHKGGVVLGIATGLQFLPMFVGGMWGGIIADRYDKRTTLIWTQALQAVLADLRPQAVEVPLPGAVPARRLGSCSFSPKTWPHVASGR